MAGEPPPGQRRLLRAAAAAALVMAGVVTMLAAADAEVALHGRRATATVEEVGEARRSRQGIRYEAKLRADDIVAWADRPLRVTGGWSAPPVVPRPGDQVAVFIMAGNAPRLVPASALEGWWEWLVAVPLAWLIAAAAISVALRRPKA